jgi:hypothetical protein
MKFIKNFKEWNKVSEGLKYHVENGLDLTNSVYRLGSDAYGDLFEEVKKYWDEDNVILKGPSGWMAKNLEVGKDALYKNRKTGRTIKVKLDSPQRGGNKKFIVYHNSGKTDEDGNIIAKKIEWGDTSGLSIKNSDPSAAASFWKRHQCDQKKKMDPDKAGFWSCYIHLFAKQLGLSSTNPW